MIENHNNTRPYKSLFEEVQKKDLLYITEDGKAFALDLDLTHVKRVLTPTEVEKLPKDHTISVGLSRERLRRTLKSFNKSIVEHGLTKTLEFISNVMQGVRRLD